MICNHRFGKIRLNNESDRTNVTVTELQHTRSSEMLQGLLQYHISKIKNIPFLAPICVVVFIESTQEKLKNACLSYYVALSLYHIYPLDPITFFKHIDIIDN